MCAEFASYIALFLCAAPMGNLHIDVRRKVMKLSECRHDRNANRPLTLRGHTSSGSHKATGTSVHRVLQCINPHMVHWLLMP